MSKFKMDRIRRWRLQRQLERGVIRRQMMKTPKETAQYAILRFEYHKSTFLDVVAEEIVGRMARKLSQQLLKFKNYEQV